MTRRFFVAVGAFILGLLIAVILAGVSPKILELRQSMLDGLRSLASPGKAATPAPTASPGPAGSIGG